MILSCSPRPGGNSDYAAGTVLQAAASAAFSPGPEITYLRDCKVFPCTGCGRCSASPGRCPLSEKDDAGRIFSMLHAARELVLISPIYFYHLPAHLKALVDRSQTYWTMPRKVKSPDRPLKKAHIVLIAGRQKGENLFTGSLLTCKYWLSLFGFELAEPLVIYGVDERGDLAADEAKRETLAAYARGIYARAGESGDKPGGGVGA